MTSPCKGCQERTLGCHDVEVCQKWREYVEIRKKAHQAKMEIHQDNRDWEQHLRRHGYKFPRK